MKVVYGIFIVGLALPLNAHSQTTLSNLDQDGITSPNQFNNNLRLWGYATGAAVGCNNTCTPTGSASHTNYYSVDGDSLQLNLAKDPNCTSGCYGDLDFSDKLYLNDATASNATSFTLDGYVTMDSVGNSGSQALEFTIEQDLPSSQASTWDRYIYSWQCNYKGTYNTNGESIGGIWNYWDGSKVQHASNPGNPVVMGDWEPAKTTQGNTVPCAKYAAPVNGQGQFVHYYFHFSRLPNRQIEFLDFTAVDSSGHSTYNQFNKVVNIQNPQSNWSTGLFAAFQLDGDTAQTPYSVWLDEWKVAYQ